LPFLGAMPPEAGHPSSGDFANRRVHGEPMRWGIRASHCHLMDWQFGELPFLVAILPPEADHWERRDSEPSCPWRANEVVHPRFPLSPHGLAIRRIAVPWCHAAGGGPSK
jgi:hypothetical protein